MPRPSAPSIPPAGLLRPGLVYVDDSATALATLRRALRSRGIWLETFASRVELTDREPTAPPLRAALLDVDLGVDQPTGLELGRAIRARDPAVAIAFFTSEPIVPVEQLRALGTVLYKEAGIEQAVDWLLAQLETG